MRGPSCAGVAHNAPGRVPVNSKYCSFAAALNLSRPVSDHLTGALIATFTMQRAVQRFAACRGRLVCPQLWTRSFAESGKTGGQAASQHDDNMKEALKDTQGKAGEKGGGVKTTDAASPISKAKHGDLGDDRGGDPSKAKKEDPQKTAGSPDTHTAHDKDTGTESTTEKVGSAQRSRQPGSIGTPSAGARGTGGGTA